MNLAMRLLFAFNVAASIVLLLGEASGIAQIGADDVSTRGTIGLLAMIVFGMTGFLAFFVSPLAFDFMGIRSSGWQSRMGRTVILALGAFALTIVLGIFFAPVFMIAAIVIGVLFMAGVAARWIYLGDMPTA
ncbi:hypothetical protein K3175_00780 [Qipengyuania sp. GH1]|uniref:hypothetical protein n=1 Tax=Qipengyuania aestuarii TaxID=2867241 RepID=UPI001C86D0AB|nr:hypothetical protein [Qipengyuania aestuarii]MBX7534185.1 hypothetical protein [Qipengyuania aestuarii]